MAAQAELNMKKVEELAFRVVGDMGGAFIMALGYIGDRLGLYKAMDGAGPITSGELASMAGLNERYLREWQGAMVADGDRQHHPKPQKYPISPDQACVLSHED